MSGIYIHIPFCKQACSYCDFYFLTKQELRQPFVEALLKEIRSYKDSEFTEKPIKTVYIGGGTPSLLTETQLGSIFNELGNVFDLSPEELTMELNPDDVSVEYLDMIREFGVNRASMGIQSFHKEILGFMHRAHNREEALSALEALQTAGFPSFTADLIYGNPGQTAEMLQRDVEQLLAFNPPHISAYSLTVEPGTRLGKEVALGRVVPAGDEAVAGHFDLVKRLLEGSGVEHYEVSNFARPGKEALHNSNYWSHQNYLGFGPSAHSFWWDENGARRWRNKPDLRFYLKESPTKYKEKKELLSLESLAEERLMLGLRTREGVSTEPLKNRYYFEFSDRQKQWIEVQAQQGSVTFENGSLKMTHKGLKIVDHLVVQLLSRG